jgi:hypothetical protein
MQVTPALLRSSTDKVIAPLACRALFKQMATLPIVRVRKYPANRCVTGNGRAEVEFAIKNWGVRSPRQFPNLKRSAVHIHDTRIF